MSYSLAIGMPGLFEWIIIGGIGLLIFGKRLPEVGRSVGQMIVQFKKGMRDVEADVEQVDHEIEQQPRKSLTSHSAQPVAPEAAGHKFDPYTGKPIDQTAETTQATKD